MDVEASEDPKDVVRRGYDRLSEAYDRAFGSETKYGPWIRQLLDRLPAAGRVLDVGCGTGIPVARALCSAGHRVLGADISGVQVRRARQLVPEAEFVQADAVAMRHPEAAFDAVVCMYSLIHIPVHEQPDLLARIASWLGPGGWLLCTTGHRAWTGVDDDWLGSGTAMWWSHADAATYRCWIIEAGLALAGEEFVPEGEGGHMLFWARRPGP